MSVNSVTSTNSIYDSSTSSTDSSSALPQQTLGQSDFLNLLVTQMENQDPMNPMSDTDFIAQMASFTSLEQSKDTEASIQSMQANDLIGRQVMVQGSDGVVNTGTVSGVLMDSGAPNLVVNGQLYTLDEVVSVATAATNTTTQGASS